MFPQSLPLTIDGTVLKESDNAHVLGVTFDLKMTFVLKGLSKVWYLEKIVACIP